jgi:hypothetical protein
VNKISSIIINNEDKTDELNEFVRFLRIPEEILPRCSLLLILQLYHFTILERTLNPAKVVDEILGMEGLKKSITKEGALFKKEPLKGLWHKHYFADGLNVMSINIRNALDKYGIPWFSQKIKEVKESGEERYVSQEDIAKIVDEVVSGNWERKVADGGITGEWLIYAKHEDKPYYLCIAKHDSGDINIRKLIDDFCLVEFPFLNDILCLHESQRQ